MGTMVTAEPVIPRLLTVAEVARLLRISKTQAYRMAHTGHIPTVRVGEVGVRVDEADLARYIEARRAGGSP